MKESIHFYEIGPRDGFQNQKEFIQTEDKKRIIDAIVASGIKMVQCTSFVSPKAIAQMQDASEIARYCVETYPDVAFSALAPNLRGAENAWNSGIRSIAYVVSLSKSHNRANINRTHDESFADFCKIREAFPDMFISLDLATTFGCPFEGKYPVEAIVSFLKKYVEAGVDGINLCDSIGVANPCQTREVVSAVKTAYPHARLDIHIHDTRNMGMVNTLAAIESGVQYVQASLGGLGGCPFAPGATGNLSSEDLIYMLNHMGYTTGVEFEKLLHAARLEKELIPNGNFSGHHINICAPSCSTSGFELFQY